MSAIDRNVRLDEETLRISESGIYEGSCGEVHLIQNEVQTAIANTTSHPPDEVVPKPHLPSFNHTAVRVVNTDTLTAASHFAKRGEDPLALNFASARNPGGGFLHGANAQEESLCRRSALYVCLQGREMYEYHNRQRGSLYTSWALYSPKVPVFRDANGLLSPEPWLCSFLTMAAPNETATPKAKRSEIPDLIRERTRKVLALAALKGHTCLVLGAWGCGVFGCDPKFVATCFKDHLVGEFKGVFQEVVFAILDPGGQTIQDFTAVFNELTK